MLKTNFVSMRSHCLSYLPYNGTSANYCLVYVTCASRYIPTDVTSLIHLYGHATVNSNKHIHDRSWWMKTNIMERAHETHDFPL